MRRTRFVVALAAGVLLASATVPLSGQEVVLSVDEAIERAHQHNPGFRRALNDLELSDYAVRGVWLNSILPTVSISPLNTTNMSWQRVVVATDFFGNPLPNPEARMRQTSRSSQGASASLSLNLPQFMQLRQQHMVADERARNVEVQSHALRSEIVGMFLDVQERQLALELEERLLETDRLHERHARHLFSIGRAGRVDVLSGELAVQQREAQIEDGRAALSITLLGLRNAIGDPELPADFGVEPAPVGLFDPRELDADALVDRALASNPQIRAGAATLMTLDRGRSMDLASWWLPTVSLSAGTSRQSFVEGAGGFFDLMPESDWSRSVSLSVGFPDMGQYFRRRNASAQTDIGIRNQRETLRETRGQVEEQVRSHVVELRSAYTRLLLQERQTELAEERLRLMQEEYLIGRHDLLQLQQAADAVAQARRTALQLRFGFERTRLNLERALGGPLGAQLDAGAPDAR
jgi:outer membrane protein TolC